MLQTILRAMLISTVVCFGATFANAQSVPQGDPTDHQIYEAAASGRIDQAEQMIGRVLKDHPTSAKAHYVAAEVYAKAGDLTRARDEFSTAERLRPGLPFASPEAVQQLRAELRTGSGSNVAHPVAHSSARAFSFPWGLLLLIVAAVAVVWAMLRRRSVANAQYANSLPAAPGGPQQGPGYYGPGPGGFGSGGMGSGIAGGLASGLAVGAGVVAGEELARHFLDGNRHSDAAAAAVPPDHGENQTNADMGGSDFGVSPDESASWDDNNGSSWDDGGSFGGDGGGDWS